MVIYVCACVLDPSPHPVSLLSILALTMNDERDVAPCVSGSGCPREPACEQTLIDAHESVLIDLIWLWVVLGEFLHWLGCSSTITQCCHTRLSVYHLSLSTLYITFTPCAWKRSFLVLMGMWGNRKINIPSFLWQPGWCWSQKHCPCSFATALSFEFHLWRAINWIIEKLLFAAWNQWSSKGVKVKES